MPAFKVRRGVGLFRRAGENEVGDLEVALRPAVGRGLGVHRFGHQQGGLAHLVAGAVVAADGGIHLAFMDDHGVVADGGRVFVRRGIRAEQQGEDDEGVLLGNEAAARFHFGDLQTELVNEGFQLAIALGGEAFDGEVFLGLFQPLFPAGQEGVRCFRLLRPGIAGEGLVIVRHVDVLIQCRHAVAIRAVRHHVHLGLDEEGLAVAGGVHHFEDGFAVEKVMPVQDAIQACDVALDAVGLVLIQLVVEAGHLGRRQHLLQPGQQGGKLGIDAGQFIQALVCLRHADGKLKLGLVGLRVLALHTGKGPLFGDEVRLDGDAVVEGGHVHVFARHIVVRERRRRGGHFFDHLLHDFLDDLRGHGHFHFLHHLLGDHGGAIIPRGGDQLLQRVFDLPGKGRERQHQQGGNDDQQQQADEISHGAFRRLVGAPGAGAALFRGRQGRVGWSLHHAGSGGRMKGGNEGYCGNQTVPLAKRRRKSVRRRNRGRCQKRRDAIFTPRPG